MKKFFSVFFSILLVLGMVSCSNAFNSGTYIMLNLSGKAAREVESTPEIAYFNVRVTSIKDRNYQELFNGKIAYGTVARIDDLIPGETIISIDAVSPDGDIIGTGSKTVTLKLGANRTSIGILVYNEIFPASREPGSESNPFTNLSDLITFINQSDTPKTQGYFVKNTALSVQGNSNFLNEPSFNVLSITGGKKISLHFVSDENASATESATYALLAVPVEVSQSSRLTLSGDGKESNIQLVRDPKSQADAAGMIHVKEDSMLTLNGIGFPEIQLENGSLTLNNTPRRYGNLQSDITDTNRVFIPYSEDGLTQTVTLKNRNCADIYVESPTAQINLSKDCVKNHIRNEGSLIADGVFVDYDYAQILQSQEVFDLITETAPGHQVPGLKVNVASRIEGNVDLNDYIYLGSLESSDYPALYFGNNGEIFKCITKLSDLLSLESGMYYASSNPDVDPATDLTIKGNYTVKARQFYSAKESTSPETPDTLYFNVDCGESPYKIPADSSLTLKSLSIDTSSTTQSCTTAFEVEGKLVLEQCKNYYSYGNSFNFVLNKGSLTLNDSEINNSILIDDSARETVLKGTSYASSFTYGSDNVVITLESTFTPAKSSQMGIIKLSFKEGDKLVENKGKINDIAQSFALFDFYGKNVPGYYLADTGILLAETTSYSDLEAAITAGKSIIPISTKLDTATIQPIVITKDVTIVAAGITDSKPELNYSNFASTGPMFTVKNGATLTLSGISISGFDMMDQTISENEFPLISVEQGGTLITRNCSISGHKLASPETQQNANLIDVYGKLNLTDGTIISNGLAEGIPQTVAPLIYVAPKGELAASKTSFGCSNNSIYDSYNVYANIIYADGKVTLDNCALSNIEDYTSGSPYLVRYNDTYIPTDTIASAGTNPLILASDTSTVTLNDTRLYGNSVKRAKTSDIKRGSFIHTVATGKYHMDNSRATLNLTDVKGYLCNGEYCIVTESPNHTGYYEDHADPLFKVATIKNLSFENCNSKTTYANIYTYGDLYVEGELNLPQGMYFHFYCIGDEYFWYLPKLYKTGTIINTTVNEDNESIKIPVDYYYPRAKTSKPSYTKDPYHGKVLTTPSSDIKIEDGEIFNLFAMNRNDYAVDVDGYVSCVLTSASASNIGYAVPDSTVNYWTLADNVTVDNTISIPSSRTEEQISVATTDPVKLTLKASPAFKYEGSYYFALKGKNKNFSIVAQDDNDNTSIVEVNSDYSSSTLYLSDVILGSSDKKATGLVLNKGNVVAENSDFLSSLKTGIIVQPENPGSSSLTFKGNIGLKQIEICGICPINLTEANIVDPSFHLPSSLTFIISDDLLSAQNGTLTLPISGLKDKIEQCTFLTSENEAATIKNVTDTSVTLSF